MKHFDQIVIGGGISGLSEAYKNQQSGRSVLILEKSKWGGVIQSEKNEWGIQEKGPNSIALTPSLRKLIDDLGIKDQVIHADAAAQKRYIFLDGRPVEINPKKLLFSGDILGFRSKFALLTERFRKAKTIENETLGQAIERRFNAEILNKLVNPVVTGIYAGDPKQLEYKSSLKRLYEFETNQGSFTKGFLKAKKSGNKREIISFKGGMHTLIECLLSQIKDKQITDIKSIKKEDGRWVIETSEESFSTDSLCLATPPHIAYQLLSDSVEIPDSVASIPMPNLVTRQVIVSKNQVGKMINSFGMLFPAIENKTLKGVIHQNCVFPELFDDSVIAFNLFYRNEDQGAAAIKELKEIYDIKGDFLHDNVVNYDKSIPQTQVGHARLMEEIDQLEKEVGNIKFIGNWRTGVAVGDCV